MNYARSSRLLVAFSAKVRLFLMTKPITTAVVEVGVISHSVG